MNLIVQPNGAIRCVYDESIELSCLGHLRISRASHVEPDQAGQWHADLSPVDGPRLGPFAHRSEALATEAAWLNQWLA